MRRLLTAMLVIATFSACSDSDDNQEPADEAVGSYVLQSVGGNVLPHYVGQDGDSDNSIIGATLVLDDDGTYTLTIDWLYDLFGGGEEQDTETRTGTWDRD